MSRLLQSVKQAATENAGGAFLLTSVTAVTGIFTALGFTGGLLGRIARNHPELALAAFIGAVLALCSALLLLCSVHPHGRECSLSD